jgi:hypothetical protein
MFKHITTYPWSVSRLTVWGYEGDYGVPMVADCYSKNTPLATQRANARLIAIAPQMFEILQGLTDNEAAQELVHFMNKEDACE